MRLATIIAATCLVPGVAFADEPVPDDTPTPAPEPGPAPEAAPAPDPAPAPAPAPAPVQMPPSVVAPTSTFTSHAGEPTDRFGQPILAPLELPVGSRRTALIATGITGGLVLVAAGTYFYGAHLIGTSRIRELGLPYNPDVLKNEEEKHAALGRADRWMTASFVFVCGAVVSGAVTGYLWTRTQSPPRRLLIHPTSEGAAVSYGGSF